MHRRDLLRLSTLGGAAPGSIAPGNGGIGTLVINGALSLAGTATMEIDRNAGRNDFVEGGHRVAAAHVAGVLLVVAEVFVL